MLFMLFLMSLMLLVRALWAAGAIFFKSLMNLLTLPKALMTSNAAPSLVPLVALARKSARPRFPVNVNNQKTPN